MTDDSGVLGRVRTAAALRVLFVPHAIKAMARLAVLTAYVPDPALNRRRVVHHGIANKRDARVLTFRPRM